MPRKRSPKRWTASGYEPATKRKKHLGTYDSSKEARAVEAAWKLRTKTIGRETCDHFAERWARDYPRPADSTNKHNAERVAAFARDFKGIRLADVDKPTARKWALAHRGNVPAVRAMFGDAERDGLVTANPFSNLRLPGSRGRKNIVPLTEPELHELAALCLDPRMELEEYGPVLEAMTLFAGYVGLRPGELFALKASKVHSGHARIDTLTKTDQPRTVVVPRPARDALRRTPLTASGLLFESPRGKQWTTGSHGYYWRRLRVLAGHPGMSFYSLRHSAATMLLARGVTPWDVAIQLGHEDGGWLVQNLYGHPSKDAARVRIAAAYEADVLPLRAAGGGR